MAKKKVGELIKEARADAGMTQEQLARKVKNVSASDISKAERGEKDLTQEALKQIAKATGVTQKSLLEAASGSSSAKKTSEKKSDETTKKTTAKKSGTSAKKTGSSGTSMKVSAAEKRIIELYRDADSETKKSVEAMLKGKVDDEEEGSSIVESLLGSAVDILSNLGK